MWSKYPGITDVNLAEVLGGVMKYRKGGYPCFDNLATKTHKNLESSNRDQLLINQYDEKVKINL